MSMLLHFCNESDLIISSVFTEANPCGKFRFLPAILDKKWLNIAWRHCSDFQIVTLVLYYPNAICPLQANNLHERNRKAYRQ